MNVMCILPTLELKGPLELMTGYVSRQVLSMVCSLHTTLNNGACLFHLKVLLPLAPAYHF